MGLENTVSDLHRIQSGPLKIYFGDYMFCRKLDRIKSIARKIISWYGVNMRMVLSILTMGVGRK